MNWGWSEGMVAVLGGVLSSPWPAVVAVLVAVVIVVLATYLLVAFTGIAPRVKIREKTTIEFERLAPGDEASTPGGNGPAARHARRPPQ